LEVAITATSFNFRLIVVLVEAKMTASNGVHLQAKI